MSKNRSIKARTKNTNTTPSSSFNNETKIYPLSKLLKKTSGPDMFGTYHISTVPLSKGIIAVGFLENNKITKVKLPQFSEPEMKLDGDILGFFLDWHFVSISKPNLIKFMEQNATRYKINNSLIVWIPMYNTESFHLVKFDTTALMQA